MNLANLASKITNTYAEAFEGIFCRIIVTADDEQTLKRVANDSTSTPAVVIGRTEGGIEKFLTKKQTPDKRLGVVLQFWAEIKKGLSFSDNLKKFETELSYRIRQDILVKPFTAVFDGLTISEGKLDMMNRVGHCGDGYEWLEKRYGREVIIIPLMVPDFVIERYIGYSRGIMGANFWMFCSTKTAVKKVGINVLDAIHKIPGVITPFDICAAGSKPETKYSFIGPTTNHYYCPSLKKKLGSESKVPQNINFIPEIVLNGTSIELIEEAMKMGIEAALKIDGVEGISAGNYGGKLGKYKIYLRELLS